MHDHRLWQRLLTIALIAVLLLPSAAAPSRAEGAAGAPDQMANLVVFVKLKGDSRDIFNAVYRSGRITLRNWERIRAMYDSETNSFANYIRTISEGQLEVLNCFPQAYAGPGGQEQVRTLELSRSHYDLDTELVDEVVGALADGTIPLTGIPQGRRLDDREQGFLDNLTIVLQGADFNGRRSAYKSNYSGEKHLTVNGTELRVGAYNALCSNQLVSPNGGYHVGAEQGVIAHEFLHTLGWPDLYRVNGGGVPVGAWDVMASASFFLQYPLSWQRAREGWIQGQEITQSGTYTLTAVGASGDGTRLFTIKTPMAEAASETICLEYRVKNSDLNGFDHRIPSSGLLMYRVNDSVPDRTNGAGKNYIYVYRPGVTDPEAAQDKVPWTGLDLSYRAALDPSKGQTSYGSTDLSAPFSEDTLYYSTGRNSGVRISSAAISADGDRITFRVDFSSDYDEWQVLGGPLDAAGASSPSLYTDPETGSLYAVCLVRGTNGYQVTARHWDPAQSVWTRLGRDIPVGWGVSTAPRLAVHGGTPYLVCLDGSGRPVRRTFDGTNWSAPTVLSQTAYPQFLQLISDGDGLYAVYSEAVGTSYSKRLVIQDVETGRILTNSRTAGGSGSSMFSELAAVKMGKKIYVLTCEFPKGAPQIEAYDLQQGSWTAVHKYSGLTASNIHALQVWNGKLYAFAGGAWQTPVFSVWNGETWTDTSLPGLEHCLTASIQVVGGTPFLTYLDTTEGRDRGRLLSWTGSGLTVCADDLGTSLIDLATASDGKTLYTASVVMGSDALWVRGKALGPMA